MLRKKGMGFSRLVIRALVALGILICILSGSSAAVYGWALLRSPDAPLPSTVAAAPQHRWVSLEDAVLDCSTQRTRRGSTLVLAHDRSGAHPFLAQLAGRRACEGSGPGPVDGAFVGPYARVFRWDRKAFDLPGGRDLSVFSQLRAPRFLRRALFRWLAWFGPSLLLTILATRALLAPDSPRPARS